jgi:hypothetical protein
LDLSPLDSVRGYRLAWLLVQFGSVFVETVAVRLTATATAPTEPATASAEESKPLAGPQLEQSPASNTATATATTAPRQQREGSSQRKRRQHSSACWRQPSRTATATASRLPSRLRSSASERRRLSYSHSLLRRSRLHRSQSRCASASEHSSHRSRELRRAVLGPRRDCHRPSVMNASGLRQRASE